MRLLLVGTDLAPVHPEGGAIELLLSGWAAGLAVDHDVWVASVPGAPDPRRPSRDPAGSAAGRVQTATFRQPPDLRRIVAEVEPDVVVCNNRPGWQVHLRAPTLHLLHNWPDAWALEPGRRPDLGGARVAAVSAALAAAASDLLEVAVGVVDPWVHPAFLEVEPRPEAGTVLFPNRLLAKKGVAELCAAAALPALAGCRVRFTDHLSPWPAPTAEHRALRLLVGRSPRCELIPAARTRAEMASLYARADVVVCPSIHPEGIGLAAIEAQAAGVPVVSSGRGGLLEAVARPDLITDPADPQALASAIRAAMAVTGAPRASMRAGMAARYGFEGSTRSLGRAVAETAAGPAGPQVQG